jgi:PadR family transcriptional regulator, regulatory protein AphA
MGARRENKSRYAILGLLSMWPMSGYDVRKTIDASLGNFWSESYGQIYPILRRLVDEGLATRHTEPGDGRPDRHVYTITPEGKEELRAWLARPAESDVGRIEILLKLFFGWQLPPVESARQVERFREVHEGRLTRYAEIETWLQAEKRENPERPYWLMTLSYGRHASRALLAWCDETLETLSMLESGVIHPEAGPIARDDGPDASGRQEAERTPH